MNESGISDETAARARAFDDVPAHSGIARTRPKDRDLRISHVAFPCGLIGGAVALALELWERSGGA